MSTEENNDQDAAQQEKEGPLTADQLVEMGWDREQAEYLCAFDAVMEGRDATLVLPVTLHALENIATYLEPEAMTQVAALFAQASARIRERAREKAQPQDPSVESQLQVLQQLPQTLKH